MPGRRPAAALALVALLVLVPPAAAEPVQSVEANPEGTAPLLKPGQQGSVPVRVRYCYANPPLQPAQVTARVAASPGWASAQVSPTSFRADPAGQRCGTQSLALQWTVTRAAPAYKAESIRVEVTSAGIERPAAADVPIQAEYAAELDVKRPPRVRIERGEQGSLRLEVTVGANDSTRIEITGRDAQALVTMRGITATSAAGNGLDDRKVESHGLDLAVSSDTPLGVRPFSILVKALYERSPATVGDNETVQAEIEVVEAARTPGFEAATALGAAVAAGMALRARGRRRA